MSDGLPDHGHKPDSGAEQHPPQPTGDLEALLQKYGPAYCRDWTQARKDVRIPGAWTGSRLWNETQMTRMLEADIEGDEGVEGCYERSLISAEAIRAIRAGTFTELQSLIQSTGQKVTGMLHEFRRPPIKVEDPKTMEKSVCQQMHEDIAAGIRRRTGEDDTNDKAVKPVYRGAVLVPRTRVHSLLPPEHDQQRKVLAWATWTESVLTSAEQRTYQKDRSVRQVRDTLNTIRFDQGIKVDALLKSSGRVLLLDTINAHPEAPGAASVLFAQLVPLWARMDYEWILLYRHKILEVMQKKDGAFRLPQWHNEASRQFFHQRGFRDIGTRLSPIYAERDIPTDEAGKEQETVRVRSTEGWMLGQLPDIRRLVKEIDERYRSQFGD